MIQLKKTLLTLVALLAVTTGAWADETETLLTTITATGKDSYSETTPGVVTVTHDNDYFSDDLGWFWMSYPGSLTVEAKKGYTITKCVFNQPEKTPVTVSTAPSNVNFIYNEGNDKYICVGTDPNEGIVGFKSIKVYGYASPASAVEVAWNKTSKTGTFTMPGGNVIVTPEYWPYAALASADAVKAAEGAEANTDALLVTEADNAVTGGTLMYAIGTNATTAPTTGWGTAIPTAEGYHFTTATDVYVWYYIVGDDEHSDTEPQCLTVSVLEEPKYKVEFAEGTNESPNSWTVSPTAATNPGVVKGTPVTVTYEGPRKVIGVKAVKKAAADNPAPTTASIEDYTAGTFGWNGDGSAATGLPTINTFAANDKISILSANNSNTQFTTSAGGASATFSGTATDDSKFYAVYPYTAGLTLSGDVITGIVIPTSQWNSNWERDDISYSGWDPKAPIAYATTTGSSLTFHNVCAILKVTITGYGSFAIFTISANEPLAGTFSLDTSTGTLTPTSGSTTVTVGNGIYVNSFNTEGGNKTAYIAIAPGTYTNFKLYLYNEDEDDKTITKSGSVTFEAGKIYDLGSYNIENF